MFVYVVDTKNKNKVISDLNKILKEDSLTRKGVAYAGRMANLSNVQLYLFNALLEKGDKRESDDKKEYFYSTVKNAIQYYNDNEKLFKGLDLLKFGEGRIKDSMTASIYYNNIIKDKDGTYLKSVIVALLLYGGLGRWHGSDTMIYGKVDIPEYKNNGYYPANKTILRSCLSRVMQIYDIKELLSYSIANLLKTALKETYIITKDTTPVFKDEAEVLRSLSALDDYKLDGVVLDCKSTNKATNDSNKLNISQKINPTPYIPRKYYIHAESMSKEHEVLCEGIEGVKEFKNWIESNFTSDIFLYHCKVLSNEGLVSRVRDSIKMVDGEKLIKFVEDVERIDDYKER